MKSPFSAKTKAAVPPPADSKGDTKNQPAGPDGKKQILTGLVFVSASFLGAIFLLYLTVTAQSAKEVQLKDLHQKLVVVSTEKEVASHKAEALAKEVGRVLDLDRVVSASKKIHSETEVDRKAGSLWIDRKTGSFVVTLGILNGVTKGNRLAVYEGENKFATLKVNTALDVVSYTEPVDKKLTEFLKDYYTVKME